MDYKVEAFYKKIYSDLSIDREETAELNSFLASLNPPPDKLVKIRATAFKIGASFLSTDDDTNKKLLRSINSIVHAVEANCMEPKDVSGSLDEDGLVSFYGTLMDGSAIDMEESEELNTYFKVTNPPGKESLVKARNLAFQVGSERLTSNTETNTQVLRCVNVIVHTLEMACYQPKPYKLKLNDSMDLNMSLSQAVQHMWNSDANRLTPGDDFVLNVGTGKKPYWKEDSAHAALFTSIDSAVWKRPTYAAFLHLLDNYIAATGSEESFNAAERSEVSTFLSSCCNRFGLNCTVANAAGTKIAAALNMCLWGRSRTERFLDFTIGFSSIWKRRRERSIIADTLNRVAETRRFTTKTTIC
jgi:Endoribonuclease XendoU